MVAAPPWWFFHWKLIKTFLYARLFSYSQQLVTVSSRISKICVFRIIVFFLKFRKIDFLMLFARFFLNFDSRKARCDRKLYFLTR